VPSALLRPGLLVATCATSKTGGLPGVPCQIRYSKSIMRYYNLVSGNAGGLF
jgi:hypothetical protein